jgi:hypothetical protein
MPFFITSDFTADLPTGFDVKVADRALIKAEAELRQMGLVFDNPTAEVRNLAPSPYFDQSIFSTTPAKNITFVQIVNKGDVVQVLTENTDYAVSHHPNYPDYTTRFRLIKPIYLEDKIEITAKWGLFIDKSQTNDFGVKLLKATLTNYLLKQLEQAKTDGKELIRSKEGDTEVQYSGTGRQFATSFVQDPEFINDLLYFNYD